MYNEAIRIIALECFKCLDKAFNIPLSTELRTFILIR